MEKYQAQLTELLQHPAVDPLFTKIEAKAHVKREHVAGGTLALLALYLIFGAGAEFICNFIGFIYPAYCSIKALETSRKDDDTQWLTYWVVYAVLSIIELPFDLLILSYFPIYWLAKTVFLMWCYLPTKNNGADFVYKRLIRPLFKVHEPKIDKVFEDVADKVAETLAPAKDIVADAKDIVADAVYENIKAGIKAE